MALPAHMIATWATDAVGFLVLDPGIRGDGHTGWTSIRAATNECNRYQSPEEDSMKLMP